MGLYTGINPVHIMPTSRMVTEYTGMAGQPHKAVVGANAFQHESGIHQDGVIKNVKTYEIMSPETIGLARADTDVGIVLGKHSGRNAVSTRLRELGYDLEGDKFNAVFARLKEIAERRKGGLEDEDLEALVSDQAGLSNKLWEVTALQVATGTPGLPTATVKLRGPDQLERFAASTGTGPVDAVYKAIDQIMGVHVKLDAYQLNSVTEGIEALATTRVVIQPDDTMAMDSSGAQKNRKFSGSGSDNDIVTSSARAYVSALNKLLMWNARSAKTDDEQEEGEEKPEAIEVGKTEIMEVSP